MTLQEKAYKIGYNSSSIVPARSKELMDLMEYENVKVGEGKKIMDAFQKGFSQEGVDRLKARR